MGYPFALSWLVASRSPTPVRFRVGRALVSRDSINLTQFNYRLQTDKLSLGGPMHYMDAVFHS
jgi:hypothetical protein